MKIRAAGLFVAMFLSFGLLAGSAAAVSTHTFKEEWSVGAGCTPRAVASDNAGNLYVVCHALRSDGKRFGAIRKFSPSGAPINFTANTEEVSGNEITMDPGNQRTGSILDPQESAHQFGCDDYIDVDKSPAHPGYIFVSGDPTFCTGGSSETVDIFLPSGKYLTSIHPTAFDGQANGVGIDDKGYVYVTWSGGGVVGHVSKYDNHDFHELERFTPGGEDNPEQELQYELYYSPCCLRVKPDSTGAVWVGWGAPLFDTAGNEAFGKVESDQFVKDLTPNSRNPGLVFSRPSPFLVEGFPEKTCPEKVAPRYPGEVPPTLEECDLKGEDFDVDLATNDVYDVENNSTSFGGGNPENGEGGKIVPYSQGVAGDPVHQNAAPFGAGKVPDNAGGGETHVGIDYGPTGEVSITVPAANKIVKFGSGFRLPNVLTKPAAIGDIGHTTATVHGVIDPVGGGPISGCVVKIVEVGGLYSGPGVPCNETLPYPEGAPTEVSADITGLEATHRYRFRFEAENAHGAAFGANRVLEARAVLSLETEAATEIVENSARLQGRLDTDGLATKFFYEFGPDTNYGQQTEELPVSGPAGELQEVPFLLEHLQEGKTVHYRLVGSNSFGQTRGQDQSFRTASPPEITGVGAENVSDNAADIHLQINPVGFETTFQIEYGLNTSYGSEIPLGGESVGSGTVPVPKTVHLENLPSGTIHYRVVATNQWGTSSTDDTTFVFRPPPCPNAHVRQQTDSSYLPDCRAYELVTPGYAGAVQIMPGEALTNFGSTFGAFPQAPQNYGFATSPSRFVYMGGLGAVEGQEAPNALLDMYLATRTVHGWVTTFPGIKGYEAKFTYGFGCSETMELCVSYPGESTKHNAETNENERVPPSESPFLYQAGGNRISRLPTNVGVVPGGADFDGDKRLSGDFSHFVFSTTTEFTPGAETEAPGTVYDNDIQAKTVVPISRTESGAPIPELANDGKTVRPTGIADVSHDGSHILMAATTHEKCSPDSFPFKCEYGLKAPAVLYMSINDILVRDVSRGKLARFVGMTKDGSKVLFTTTEKLIPQDKDTSADMYLWRAEDNSLQLISQQGNLGNGDSCSATWIEKCGVEAMYPTRVIGSEAFDDAARVPGLDDQIAYESGDVYFYSPEDLVPGEVGADGQRNLYLFHAGHLQLVTTFEPGTQADRVTISGDGSHAAFMTKSSLTSYNSQHHNEVYAYDAARHSMRCASCNPNGTAPMSGETVVTVSESGPFMSNDGRVFFASKESLVPQDTDGIRDIYEYTEGRPQLISSGTGDRESTGGSEQIGAFFGDLQTGLESVSRDGTNVYFSTFETLVPEDKNGSFLKVYDARVGGGFDFNPDLGECAAADECHGVGTQAPAPAQLATGGSLGASGNLPAPGHAAKKKHRKPKKHLKRKHHRGNRAANRDRGHGNG